MRTLVIGDTHFHDSNKWLRRSQIEAISNLYINNLVDNVIFLGDVFDKRKPSPECIIDVKTFFDSVSVPTYLIRGNHDSSNKSDDGSTILSVLHRTGKVTVINKWARLGPYVLLSHLENEENLKELLADDWPDDTIMFGHFGFDGALNNAGDADCSVSPEDFRYPTILGHIHQHRWHDNILVLGTPYDTCFHDHGDKFYAIIENGDITVHPHEAGPKFLTLTPATLSQANLYEEYTSVRLMLDRNDVATYNTNDLKKLYPEVKHWDIKYTMNYDEEQLSTYQGGELFSINDQIIEDYLEEANTSWTKKQLLDVLNEDPLY